MFHYYLEITLYDMVVLIF